MADNVVANAGSGGSTFAADDIASVFYPRTKITLGADGVTDGDVSSANPMPISGAVTVSGVATAARQDSQTTLLAGGLPAALAAGGGLKVEGVAGGVAQPVSGTVTANLAAGTNNIGDVDVLTIAAGDNNIGNVDIVTVPTDPFGANADAASATGSISAKLRFIAATGIPVTSVPSHAVTNIGTFAVQVDGNALTALQKIDDPVIVDDAGFTPATSSVMMAGYQADETGTDSVDEGDAGAGRMTLDRKQITTPQPHTAGGLSIFRSLDLDEGTCEIVKNSPGNVYGFIITNLATSIRYIKFYDATSGTVGTGTPAMTVPVPGNATDDTTLVFNQGGMGITFATGIVCGASTGLADNDTGAPGANDVLITVFYK